MPFNRFPQVGGAGLQNMARGKLPTLQTLGQRNCFYIQSYLYSLGKTQSYHFLYITLREKIRFFNVHLNAK